MKPLVLLPVVFALASCAGIAPPSSPGTVDHVVMIWQKRPGNEADRAALLAACEKLRVIPGIRSLDAGRVLPSERPVVDDSFDVGLVVRFDSARSLHGYETDPRHVKQVNEVLKPLSRKIVAYDVIH